MTTSWINNLESELLRPRPNIFNFLRTRFAEEAQTHRELWEHPLMFDPDADYPPVPFYDREERGMRAIIDRCELVVASWRRQRQNGPPVAGELSDVTRREMRTAWGIVTRLAWRWYRHEDWRETWMCDEQADEENQRAG